MKTLLSILQNILKYQPLVNTGVQEVEQSLAGSPGATKKQVVLAAVLAATHAGEAVPIPTVQLVSGLIDMTVSTLKQTGVFGGSAPATAPATAPVNAGPVPVPAPATAPANATAPNPNR